MKSSIIALSVAALLAFGAANASAPAAAPAAKPAAAAAATPAAAPVKTKTAQQQKMGDCATANKGKKGADYKTSVSNCMKGGSAKATSAAAAPAAAPAPAATPAAAGAKPASAAQMSQQDRMKSCNADAAKQKLAGDARKTFMSSCLKKK